MAAPGTGRRPILTLADRLLSALVHYRFGLPQVAIAELFTVRPETLNRRMRETRQLLQQAGHIIQPSPDRLPTLEALYDLVAVEGIIPTPKIKAAC